MSVEKRWRLSSRCVSWKCELEFVDHPPYGPGINQLRSNKCHIMIVCLYSYLSCHACKTHFLRCSIFLSVACLAVLYFNTLSHKWHDCREIKDTEHKLCVLIFSTTLKHLSCQEEFSEIFTQMYKCFHVKFPFSCEILMKLKFSRQIFEKSTNIIFIKIRPVGAETLHTDRQTWMWQ